MAIAPWIVPPNYMDAMRAGAGLGLQQRAQDTAESEAADRLRLAYEGLASQERRAREAVQARQQVAQAQLGYHRMQQASMDQYRQAQERHMAEQSDIARQQLGVHAADILARQAETAAWHKEAAADRRAKRALEQQKLEAAGLKPYESEVGRAQAAVDSATRRSEAMSAMEPKVETHWFKPDTTNMVPVVSDPAKISFAKAQLDAAKKQLDEKQSLLDSYAKSRKTAAASGSGKYKVGAVYGKKNPMRYLGGDEYDESSWEPADK